MSDFTQDESAFNDVVLKLQVLQNFIVFRDFMIFLQPMYVNRKDTMAAMFVKNKNTYIETVLL